MPQQNGALEIDINELRESVVRAFADVTAPEPPLINQVCDDDGDMVSEFTAYAFLPDKLAIDEEGHCNWWKLKLSFFSDEQFAVLLDTGFGGTD